MTFLDSMSPQEAADMARPVYEENKLLRSRLAQLTGADPDEPVADPLDAVYQWLVHVVGFPLDVTFGARPAWLDVRRLAAEWHNLNAVPGETIDDWVATVLHEAGWDEEGATP